MPAGEGKVIKHNVFNATVTVLMDDGKEVVLPAREVTQLRTGSPQNA